MLSSIFKITLNETAYFLNIVTQKFCLFAIVTLTSKICLSAKLLIGNEYTPLTLHLYRLS